jgi:hypothetical protein
MNLQKQYLKMARAFVEPYKGNENVVGITLSGGISRGTGDIYSEIDINFYVRDVKKKKDLPSVGDINVNGVWFEFKIYSYREEVEQDWNMVHRWDAQYARILFDRKGLIRKLFDKKIKFRRGEKEKMIREYGDKTAWCVQLAEMFVKRKDLVHSHLLLNEALDSYIAYYFIKNRQFIPHYKWRVYYFRRLKKPSANVRKVILDLYRIRSFSKEELKTRIRKLKKFVIIGDLKAEHWIYHSQNKVAIKNFVESLKRGVKYSDPFVDDVVEK